MAEETRLNVAWNEGVLTIGFNEKNILDEGVIQYIGNEISKLIENVPNPKLLIDFQGVEHLSSAALGTLINLKKKVDSKQGQLCLANIHPQIYEVFVITKLNKLFDIYDNAEEAQAAFD
jgi:anti-sigma B factor antagonist